jgi:hypothetical protein
MISPSQTRGRPVNRACWARLLASSLAETPEQGRPPGEATPSAIGPPPYIFGYIRVSDLERQENSEAVQEDLIDKRAAIADIPGTYVVKAIPLLNHGGTPLAVDSTVGRAMIGFLAVSARLENDLRADRIRETIAYRRAKGLPYYKHPPFGKRTEVYTDESGRKQRRWVRDDEQCRLLMEMYDLHYKRGWSLARIAELLDRRTSSDRLGAMPTLVVGMSQRGMATRASPWHPSNQVRRPTSVASTLMFGVPRYAGFRSNGRKEFRPREGKRCTSGILSSSIKRNESNLQNW